MKLSTHLLPDLIDEDFSGTCAVVIDVLRASTTIVHGCANGVRNIRPCLAVDDARALKAEQDQWLLGGERHCKLIDGFDLDNSPTSYSRDRIAGRDVAFTTSNGTRAMLKSSAASSVLVGAFANLSAVVRQAAEFDTVHLVCAGTNGKITLEDCLFAGAAVDELLANSDCELNDSSRLVLSQFRSTGSDDASIFKCLCDSQGGRNLCDAGMESDIRICSMTNTHDVVPAFDSATGTIQI